MIQKVIKQSYCSLISSSSNSCNDHIISSQISSSNFFLSMTFFFLNPTNELIKWAFHKLLLGCLFASGSSKKKKNVLLLRACFSFFYPNVRICYTLRFVYKMPPPQRSIKTSEREPGASVIKYTKRRDDRQTKKKVKVDWRHT